MTGNVTALRNPLGGAEPVLQRGLPRDGDLQRRRSRASRGSCPCCSTGSCRSTRSCRSTSILPGCPPPADAHPRRAGAAARRRRAATWKGARSSSADDRTEAGTTHGQAHRHRPGDADRGARQDHHPPRRRRPGRPTPGSTSPSSAASRSSARAGRSGRWPGSRARICGICPVSHLLASAKAGDQILAVTHPAGRREAAAADEPGPDRPVARPELLPPQRARPAAGHGQPTRRSATSSA